MTQPRGQTPELFQSLRKRAEDVLAKMAAQPAFDAAEMHDVRALMHELSIYQVELEMQNDELRRAQHDLEEARRLSDAVLATSPTGIVLVDKEGLVLRANAAASRLLGLEKVLLEGQRLSMLVDPDSLYEFQGLLSSSLANSPGLEPCEIKLRRVGGGKFHARLDCSPLGLGQDSTQHAVCTFQDISDTVQLRESLRLENLSLGGQLQQRARELEVRNSQLEELLRHYEIAKTQALSAQRAKTAFLRNMSHELRTPLHGLMSLTELLLGTLQTPEDRELVTMAQSGVVGLVELFQDLLDLADMEAAELRVRLAPAAPQPILDAVCQSMAPVAAARGLALHCAPCHPLPAAAASSEVLTDPARLKQVLLALLSNAVKFTPAGGGPVRVRCLPKDHHWCFVIDDCGPGIAPECLERALEPFVQAQESLQLTRCHDGIGAGLSIARRLTPLLQGTLLLENRPEGGARATVCVPTATVLAQSQSATS